jgi:hypothetical protein
MEVINKNLVNQIARAWWETGNERKEGSCCVWGGDIYLADCANDRLVGN